MFNDPDLPEMEENAIALMATLLQHKEGAISDDDVAKVYDSLFDDLTIDDLQWFVVLLASLSVEMLSEWAAAIQAEPQDLLRKIALVKAIERD